MAVRRRTTRPPQPRPKEFLLISGH